MDETPKPTHRAARSGTAIIAWSVDNCNRHQGRDFPPVAPKVELSEIIAAHDPDEAPIGIKADDSLERFNGKSRAQLLFNRGWPNTASTRYGLGGTNAHWQRGHILCACLERIARRNEPPNFIHSKRACCVHADVAMAFVRRIERTTKKCGRNHAIVTVTVFAIIRGELGRVRGPAICKLLGLQARLARARAAFPSQYQSLRQAQIRRHRQIVSTHCA